MYFIASLLLPPPTQSTPSPLCYYGYLYVYYIIFEPHVIKNLQKTSYRIDNINLLCTNIEFLESRKVVHETQKTRQHHNQTPKTKYSGARRNSVKETPVTGTAVVCK